MQRLASAALHGHSSNQVAQTHHVLSQASTLGSEEHPLLRSYEEWDFGDDDTTTAAADSSSNKSAVVEIIADNTMYTASLWRGFFSGLYSVSKQGMVPKPSRECLGTWIADDIYNLRAFTSDLLHDYWNVTVSEYENAWNSVGDLMFKNFDACHFKAVIEDVTAYCQTEVDDPTKVAPSPYEKDAQPVKQVGACSTKRIVSQIQSNVFGLITQGSALASQFEQDDWHDQSAEDKAYTFEQIGHTLGKFFVDFTGFRPTVLDH